MTNFQQSPTASKFLFPPLTRFDSRIFGTFLQIKHQFYIDSMGALEWISNFKDNDASVMRFRASLFFTLDQDTQYVYSGVCCPGGGCR